MRICESVFAAPRRFYLGVPIIASLVKRNGTYYLQWYVGKKIRRRTLGTNAHQIAKEKPRQFESAQLRGLDDPLSTRTPIPQVVSAYVEHIRHVKTPKSAQTDVYYLREAFGTVYPALEITSRRVTEACRKRPRKPGQGHGFGPQIMKSSCVSLIQLPA